VQLISYFALPICVKTVYFKQWATGLSLRGLMNWNKIDWTKWGDWRDWTSLILFAVALGATFLLSYAMAWDCGYASGYFDGYEAAIMTRT
jgi:hypothetical protein